MSAPPYHFVSGEYKATWTTNSVEGRLSCGWHSPLPSTFVVSLISGNNSVVAPNTTNYVPFGEFDSARYVGFYQADLTVFSYGPFAPNPTIHAQDTETVTVTP